MKVAVISDTHGDHRQMVLPDAELLIHAGDVSANGSHEEIDDFIDWFDKLDYPHKILIAGNHDHSLETDDQHYQSRFASLSFHYLNSTGVTIGGFRFWGSPITPRFFDWAFMMDEGEPLREHWANIPDGIDVLITHGPPYGIMDVVERENGEKVHAGCSELLARIKQVEPKIHLFGHIHEGFGDQKIDNVHYYNVASMNEHYRLQNAPVTIEL